MPREYAVTRRPARRRVAPQSKRVPTHPGEVLKHDVLPDLGLSISECARRLGVSRQTLHRIMAGTHPVTPEMAVRLGTFCGNGPNLWLAMQQAHDLWHAEKRLAKELKRIRTPRAPAHKAKEDRRLVRRAS